ncbi:MAG: AMP-binding protein [Succinivibrionaceae bacterium]|nr:AMP-binding protein [Succinivibrionaceae bacterium]
MVDCNEAGAAENEGRLEVPFRSLADMFAHACSAYADRPMATCFGTTCTYGRIGHLSICFSSYLLNRLRMKKGDRIALVMPNILQMPVAIIGALRAGLVIVNVNPQYTSREMHYQLLDAGVTTIVILENFADRLAEIIDYTMVRHVIVTRLGDLLGPVKGRALDFVNRRLNKTGRGVRFGGYCSFRQALKLGRQAPVEPVKSDPDDIAFIQYTGGTTGIPKGAVLSNYNLLANIQQALLEYGPVLENGRERIISALPLYHVFALTVNFLLVTWVGAHSCLVPDPRKIRYLVKVFRDFRPSIMTGVNTLYNALTFNRDFAKVDFSSLKLVVGGGCSVQKSVAERWQRITGTFILEGYGMTECSPLVCVGPVEQKTYTGSIGRATRFTQIRIVDEKGCDIHDRDTPGELWIKGPQVTRGYWNRESDNASSFTDGWFHSGDIGVWKEDGFIRLVDRKKDMILVSGFNVYPNEIEEVICTNAKVAEAAAIGVPSSSSGERVKVFVVRRDASLTEEELVAYCYQYLAHYKVPKHVEFVNSLPKSNIGKILRARLRQMEEQAAGRRGD